MSESNQHDCNDFAAEFAATHLDSAGAWEVAAGAREPSAAESQHLASCVPCRLEESEARRILGAGRASAAALIESLPGSYWEAQRSRILGRLRQENDGAKALAHRRPWIWRPALAAVCAGGLLLGIYVGGRQSATPSPAAVVEAAADEDVLLDEVAVLLEDSDVIDEVDALLAEETDPFAPLQKVDWEDGKNPES